MNKFVRFSMAFVLVLGLAFACDKDEPAAPGSQVTFDRYDVDSRPLGTAAAWYCTTSAQANTAWHGAGTGDVVYLTEDDTVYVVWVDDCSGWSNGTLASVIGIDTGPSILRFRHEVSGTWCNASFDGDNTVVTNIDFYSGSCLIKGDLEVFDVASSQQSYLRVAYTNSASGARISNVDDLWLKSYCMGACGATIYTDSVSWKDASHFCDIYWQGHPDDVLVQGAWTYNSIMYNYNTFAFNGSNAYWIAGDTLAVIANVENYDCTATLEYGDDDCASYTKTMTAFNISGETWFWTKVDISWATGSPKKTVWWNVEAKLCDEEINSGCVVKYKPKVPDGDPPIPQEN